MKDHKSSRTAAARAVGGAVLALGLTMLAGCAGDPSTSDEPADDPATSASADNPFAVEIEGPGDAEAGEEITVALTNTGRLPDALQLTVEPTGAATFSEQDFTLSPDESVDVQVTVEKVPLVLIVKSVGGGGERVADLEIG